MFHSCVLLDSILPILMCVLLDSIPPVPHVTAEVLKKQVPDIEVSLGQGTSVSKKYVFTMCMCRDGG